MKHITVSPLQLLQMMSLGKSCDDIAKELNIKPRTVRVTTKKFCNQKGFDNRDQAIYHFIKQGEFKPAPLTQKHYGNLEFDGREKDIVMVWQGKSNVIQIERNNIDKLIKELVKMKFYK